MKQRLGLAQTLLTPIQFMILDEPFVGLDPLGKGILKDVIRKKAYEDGCGILFSSHDLHDIKEICDRIVMIADGKKIYDHPFDEKKRYELQINSSGYCTTYRTFADLGDSISVTSAPESSSKISFQDKTIINLIYSRLFSSSFFITDCRLRKVLFMNFFRKNTDEIILKYCLLG